MFERFTDRARRVVLHAQVNARVRNAGEIRTEHLLLALYDVPDGLAPTVLAEQCIDAVGVRADVDALGPLGRSDAESLATLGIDLDEVRRHVEETFGPGALDRVGPARRDRRWGGHIPFEKAAKAVLEQSLGEARRMRHNHIGTEHILLGLLHVDGSARRILLGRGARPDTARAVVEKLLGCRWRAS